MPHFPAFHSASLTLLLGATAVAGAHESSSYIQGVQDSLVEYAASDFAAGRLRPSGFRNVELRYRENDKGARIYMLCGQARMGVGAKEEWVDFAAIKTDPYELWLGGPANDMSARAITVPSDGNDLSTALQTKLGIIEDSGKP